MFSVADALLYQLWVASDGSMQMISTSLISLGPLEYTSMVEILLKVQLHILNAYDVRLLLVLGLSVFLRY